MLDADNLIVDALYRAETGSAFCSPFQRRSNLRLHFFAAVRAQAPRFHEMLVQARKALQRRFVVVHRLVRLFVRFLSLDQNAAKRLIAGRTPPLRWRAPFRLRAIGRPHRNAGQRAKSGASAVWRTAFSFSLASPWLLISAGRSTGSL